MKKDDKGLAINIVLKPVEEEEWPNNGFSLFLEIENDDGEAINIGTHEIRENGYSYIRITSDDILSHEET